jgi:HrpA-like RNA helicase
MAAPLKVEENLSSPGDASGKTESCSIHIHASTTQNSGGSIRHSDHLSTTEGQSVQPPHDASPRQNKPRNAILVTNDDKKRFPSRNVNTSNDAIVAQSTEISVKSEDKIETNQQQVASQQCISGGRESSSIWIVFSRPRSIEYVQRFLRENLVAFISDIEETKYDLTQIIKSAVIQLSSNARAMSALQILKCKEELSSVQLVIELWKRIRADNKICLAKHENKIECLNENLSRLKTKKGYIDIDKHQLISEERKALHLKITECNQQRYEFEIYVEECLSCNVEVSMLNDVEAKMVRERNHLISALPIYARRSEIVETVLKSQVTVLVGETGSGKSTQVVQYLYDAGMAENGVIVCTQPRKVAAITLAKHVSKEMHVSLGEELGYKVGMHEKCCKRTKIVYMTDHMLLNECIADRQLSKYSCVLIDEAHERSINTDMLLAFIKQCLPSRNDLKLVIMSATIEPELFVKYFEKCEKENKVVSTIRVSGRTFPVEMEYDVVLSADSDYVMRAVEVVRTIHDKQPPGDILVFLTCAPEIERACKEVEYHLQHEAVVLPLHGKLPPEEQQKVFDESVGRRKIIFSTNVAETSVTIPGVKYVVDTGLSKEMHFDSRKNMDSLEVCMISKSSAEQRKGRAGRVSSGKCYRLYTMDDYASKMPDRSKPEILRIQLSHVVLKMLEFGVPNVLTFDFVEHPDRNALDAAVGTLKSVGAIEDSNLTELGRKMAVLPLQPQLSKVLLDGVSKEVGTEALISVALSSLSGQVFFRGGTDEMKEESDKKKLQFCHQLGDQMTNLSVYQCWQGVDKSQQRKWCFEQFVNAKSMRVVEEMVKELTHILVKKLKITLSLNVESLDAAECYLGKLYFNAFVNNLAVYLGHQKAGYMTTALPDSSSSFLIFPGSSLNHLGCTPKYVLYERTLKTSRQFLTQVMSVKQEWIDEAVATGRLTEDPAVTYANHMVLPIQVVCTGPQTRKEMRLKQNEVLETVLVNTAGPCTVAPVFDFSPEPKQWGVIRVIAQRKDHDALQLVVASTVGDIQQQYKKQTKEFSLTNEQDWTRAVIGAGGTVQEMIMPYQFRSVIAVSYSENESPEKITSFLQKYGKVKATKMLRNDANGLRLCVTYSTASEAKRAIKEFDSPTVRLYPQKGQQFTLRLEWERRERATHASLSFDSPQHCNTAFMELGLYITYMGFKIKISCDKYSQNKLFISGQILCLCEEQLLNEEIRRRVSPNLSLKMGYKRYDGEHPYLQPHGRKNRRPHAQNVYVLHSEDGSEEDDSESSSEEDETVSRITQRGLMRLKESMEAYIISIIRTYVEQGTFRVNFVIPREWDIRFRAYVTFDDPDEGYKLLYSDLDLKCINGKKLCVSPNLKCLLSFKQEVYTLIFEDLDKARKALLRRYPNLVYIKVIPPDKKVQNLTRISLTAYDVKVFSVAQRELHEAGQPYTLHCNTTELQEYMLSQDCHKHLQDTKETTSTYICRDPSTMVIKIYGDSKNKEAAKAAIEEKARQLFSDGALVTDLGLRGGGKAPGLMKHLVTRYGCDLNGMLEFEGVRRITLNPHLQLISVLATERGLDAVRKCVEEVSVASQVVQRKMEGEYDFECVACFTTIDEPKEIVRLECCGHAFHIDCIEIQLKPDTLMLPVRCAKEDCSEELVLKDFENLQKKLKTFRMPVLVSAAIQSFMEKNTDAHKYCPTPDCKMIYMQTEISREFICSSCSVSTCSKCHEQYHAGLSCDVYKASRKSDEELLKWMEEDPDNRKKCPKCCTPIEKNGGCLHMTCNCGAHICWLCMQCFKGESECYNHLGSCPAILPPPPPANIPHVINPAPPVVNPALPVVNPAPPIVNPAPPVVNPAPPVAQAPRRNARDNSSCTIL